MRLEFRSPHLSIAPFDPVDLPNFTILTGVNGSGKSHLLEAIEHRRVVVAGFEQGKIVRFNYESFKLENEGNYNASQIAAETRTAWQFLEQHVRNPAASWRAGMGPAYLQVSEQCRLSGTSLWDTEHEAVKTFATNMRNHLMGSNFNGNTEAKNILSLAQRLPISVDELSFDQFKRQYRPFNFMNDFLPHQLGKIVWDYYVKYRENQVNDFLREKHKHDVQVLSDEEFLRTHGPKPWDLINEILATFDSLQYRINSPEGTNHFEEYHLRLVHTRSPGLEIEFSGLSSGERVLMALVASVYKAATDNVFPDVLLLDEVDASLHPSMMKNMLNVVERVFLDRGVRVILVTHSPTTIALAPEESVYVMNRSGTQRIEKKSKQDALSILTDGFATLSQGLRLFDQLANNRVSLISEGHNAKIIRTALDIRGIRGVEVISGLEAITGKDQLRLLFDFFSRVQHVNKVIFVWDCDAKPRDDVVNNTYPFVFEKGENKFSDGGIENLFSEDLLIDFTKTIKRKNREDVVRFDEGLKNEFAEFIAGRRNAQDFVKFEPFFSLVDRVSKE